jgi:hypothetical protein
MKLLKIEGDTNYSLDAILMIVPDDYDKKLVIEQSIDIADPTITEEIDIGDQGDFYLYHAYFG